MRQRGYVLLPGLGDGEKLAFTWWHPPDEAEPNDFFRETLYIVNRDGTGLRQLIPPGALPAVKHPVWSPIGDALIYESLGAGFEHRHIFKISVAGGAACAAYPSDYLE